VLKRTNEIKLDICLKLKRNGRLYLSSSFWDRILPEIVINFGLVRAEVDNNFGQNSPVRFNTQKKRELIFTTL